MVATRRRQAAAAGKEKKNTAAPATAAADDDSSSCWWLVAAAAAVAVRQAVSLGSYSGMHTPPKFGDYEAQRHWMEVTLHLPLRDWYRQTADNDLGHWGLDYPPLTAFVSFLCGLLCYAVEPDSMALYTSRGYETATHKAIMRLTVLFWDMLCFFPAAFLLLHDLLKAKERQAPVAKGATTTTAASTAALALLQLLQPALLLIDHGHFQYNSMCLGLALLGAVCIMRGQEVWGAVLFCLALNFKHIALYYATTFFFALLSRVLFSSSSFAASLLHLAKLGITVLATFGAMWLPFCLVPASDGESCLAGMGHVLQRLFPLQRGLFEDKVANVWYVLSIPLDLRALLPVHTLAAISLFATLLGLLPSSLDILLRFSPAPLTPDNGKQGNKPSSSIPIKGKHSHTMSFVAYQRLLLGLVNGALAFFLFSFQVHEKSLLFALAPLSPLLLLQGDTTLACFAQSLGAFSMFPLLRRDGLAGAYYGCLLLHTAATQLLSPLLPLPTTAIQEEDRKQKQSTPSSSWGEVDWLNRHVFAPSAPMKMGWITANALLGLLLHLCEATLAPPAQYPHIFPLLFSVLSALNLGVLFLYTNARQWMLPHE